MTTAIRAGDRAPDFELQGAAGETVRLSDFLGKKSVVLFFYPKDETAGCTREACAFRDSYADFTAAGAEVIGISGDSAQSHDRFADHHKLPFRLLSDPRAEVQARYGVRKAFGVFPGRVTFVIDRNGIVRHVTEHRLRFRQHVTDALHALRSS